MTPLGTRTIWAALLSLSYAWRDGVPRVRQSRVGKGGCAPVSSLHNLSSFDLICMLVSS